MPGERPGVAQHQRPGAGDVGGDHCHPAQQEQGDQHGGGPADQDGGDGTVGRGGGAAHRAITTPSQRADMPMPMVRQR